MLRNLTSKGKVSDIESIKQQFDLELKELIGNPGATGRAIDVFFAYRLLLQRAPEFRDLPSYADRLNAHPGLREFIISVLDSEEFAQQWHRILPNIAVMLETSRGRFWFPLRDRGVGLDIAEDKYEPATTEALLKVVQPGMNAIDLGANIGYYSVLMARSSGTGQVWSFEPFPSTHALLVKNIRENGLEGRIFANRVAASNLSGTGEMSYVISESNNNFGSMFVSEGAQLPGHDKIAIERARVDDIVPPDMPIHVVKIDVEGSELRALDGMQRIVNEYRPKMVIEFNEYTLKRSGETPEVLADWLTKHKYTLHDVETGLKFTLKREPEQEMLTNVLAIPQ